MAWWISNEYAGGQLTSVFEEMMKLAGPAGPTALIFGDWGETNSTPFPVDILTGNADRLSGLRALFIADIESEQCEISWIQHGDITPVLTAFPNLRKLRVRGSDGLALSPVRHENLRDLVLESGGLPAPVVQAVGESDLPALEHLELWLGVEEYGGGASVDDLARILSGRSLPALNRLGLCNAENADEIAAAVASAPVVARLTELDLSMGTLGDVGAEALMAGQPLTHLKRLVLNHHFMSSEVAHRLVDDLPAVAVDVEDPQDEEEWGRYTAVNE
ncbi:STM4015 family protein [Actinoplanes sp. NPDC026670]|uniref:STM4015 family protein n=1 Tax=Actinoplanes sp. NPDC026670 TaxID=3154700 RepID=UPI0033E2A112